MTSPPEEAKEVESRPRKLVVHVVHSRLLSAPALDRVLSIALAAIGVVALVSCGLVAAAHVGDDSRLTPAAGSWMALAHYLNDGTLYPPLYDGHVFGGTRYMPLSIVLLAGVERLIGDYIVAAKVLSIVTAVALLSVVFWLLRRERCSIAVSLALVGALATSPTGLFAITSARNDALPVVLQLLALMLVVRRTSRSMATRGGGRPLCPRAGREVLGRLGGSGDRDLARSPTSRGFLPFVAFFPWGQSSASSDSSRSSATAGLRKT